MELLSEALQFASDYDAITENERHLILQAKSSILYSYGEPWGKKTSSNLFDVTMGSWLLSPPENQREVWHHMQF